MLKPSLISATLLLLAAACSKQEPVPVDPNAGMKRSPVATTAGSQPKAEGGAAASAAPAASAAEAAPAAADADEQAILKAVPTVEEAAANAAKDINADNAEQMLAEIRKEVGGQ